MEQLNGRLAAIAANVRALRVAHGLSLAQLAERCGVARTTLQKIERQQTNPTLETLVSLAMAFSVSLEHLIESAEGPSVELVRPHAGIDVSDSNARAWTLKSIVVGNTLVEVQEVHFRAGCAQTSMSHGTGAREHVFVRDGRIALGPVGNLVDASEGDYVTYLADRPHQWSVPADREASLWVIHTFPRALGGN
jgi:transcriptional regulator with XRE-family HTH domain